MDKGRIGDRTGDLCLLEGARRNKSMEEKTEAQKEIDRKLDEAGIDPDDPILNDEDKEELAELL